MKRKVITADGDITSVADIESADQPKDIGPALDRLIEKIDYIVERLDNLPNIIGDSNMQYIAGRDIYIESSKCHKP